jgi:hypothetical protein
VSEAIEKAESEEKLSPYETDEPDEVRLRRITIGANLPDVEKMSFRERSEARALAQSLGENYKRRVRYYKNCLLGMPKDSPDREWFTPEKIDGYAKDGSLNSILNSLADNITWTELQTLMEANQDAGAIVWRAMKRMAREDLAGGQSAGQAILARETPERYAQFQVMHEGYMEAWKPRNAIEQSLVETLVQAQLCYMRWLSVACVTSEHTYNAIEPRNKQEGEWQTPRLSAAETIENAMAMADRFNRLYLRTLRQMRDLRRYSVPVTINNPKQVNIAAEGGQQVNVQSISTQEEKSSLTPAGQAQPLSFQTDEKDQ